QPRRTAPGRLLCRQRAHAVRRRRRRHAGAALRPARLLLVLHPAGRLPRPSSRHRGMRRRGDHLPVRCGRSRRHPRAPALPEKKGRAAFAHPINPRKRIDVRAPSPKSDDRTSGRLCPARNRGHGEGAEANHLRSLFSCNRVGIRNSGWPAPATYAPGHRTRWFASEAKLGREHNCSQSHYRHHQAAYTVERREYLCFIGRWNARSRCQLPRHDLSFPVWIDGFKHAQTSFPSLDHFLIVSSATSKCMESLKAIPESQPSLLKKGTIIAINFGTFCFVLPGASNPTILKSTAVPHE